MLPYESQAAHLRVILPDGKGQLVTTWHRWEVDGLLYKTNFINRWTVGFGF